MLVLCNFPHFRSPTGTVLLLNPTFTVQQATTRHAWIPFSTGWLTLLWLHSLKVLRICCGSLEPGWWIIRIHVMCDREQRTLSCRAAPEKGTARRLCRTRNLNRPNLCRVNFFFADLHYSSKQMVRIDRRLHLVGLFWTRPQSSKANRFKSVPAFFSSPTPT